MYDCCFLWGSVGWTYMIHPEPLQTEWLAVTRKHGILCSMEYNTTLIPHLGWIILYDFWVIIYLPSDIIALSPEFCRGGERRQMHLHSAVRGEIKKEGDAYRKASSRKSERDVWRDLGKLRLGLLKYEVMLRKHGSGPFSNMESRPRKEVGHW